jgi:hypothetical protein
MLKKVDMAEVRGTGSGGGGIVEQIVSFQTGTSTTGTNTIPNDDTIPQNTEGVEYMTLDITPTDATNYLKIDVTFFASNSTVSRLVTALFQDATANALASGAIYMDSAIPIYGITFSHYMLAGATATTTFKVRAGGQSGTLVFNGESGSGRYYGGTISSSIRIIEYNTNGGSVADITSVWDVTSGAVATPTIGSGEYLDGGSGTTVDASGEGIILPRGVDVSAATAEGQISWDSDDDILYVGDGAAVSQIGGTVALGTNTTGAYVTGITDNGSGTIVVVGSGAETATVTLAVAPDSLDFTELSDAMTLDAQTQITLAANQLIFQVNNTGEIELNATGAFSGDVLHVHQHTGNPTGGSLAHFESVDTDVTPQVIIHQDKADIDAAVVGLLIDAVDNDDTSWTPLEIRDDSDGDNDLLFNVNYAGSVTTGGWDAGAINTASATVYGNFTAATSTLTGNMTGSVTINMAGLQINGVAVTSGAGDMTKAVYDSGDSGGVDQLTTVDSTYVGDYVLLIDTAVGTSNPKTDGALTYDADGGTLAATNFSGGGANLTSVDAATGDSATAFFDAGVIETTYGGTGSNTLTNLIQMATHTEGNYVATIATGATSTITVVNSGTENAAVTVDVANDSIDGAQLSDTLTLDAPYIITGDDTNIADGYGLIIGSAAQVTIGNKMELEVLGTGATDSGIAMGRWTTTVATAPTLRFMKSHNATIPNNTIVLDNSRIGSLQFYPADGTDFDTLAAEFIAETDDATPATGDIGMAFVWNQMPGGGGAATETMRLSAAGVLNVAGSITEDGVAVYNDNEIDEFAELDAIVTDKSLVNKEDGAVWLGTHDFTGATVTMATLTVRQPIMGFGTVPDTTGECYMSNVSVEMSLATGLMKQLVMVLKDPSADTGFYGSFEVRQDYVDTPIIAVTGIMDGTASSTTSIDFEFSYLTRVDNETIEAGWEESVTFDTGATDNWTTEDLVTDSAACTANFTAGDTVFYYFKRDFGTDDFVGDFHVTGLYFQYGGKR